MLRHPEMDETAEKYVRKLMLVAKKTFSLDATLTEDSDQSLLDLIEDERFQFQDGGHNPPLPYGPT